MTVYVDPLLARGWVLNGRRVKSCHLFTDELSTAELVKLAGAVGCRPEWFQDAPAAPHYDLTAARRAAAITAGAVAVTSRQAAQIWQLRRSQLATATRHCVDCKYPQRCDRAMNCLGVTT